MNALLMHKDRDFDMQAPLPWNEADLRQDLELDVLFDAMASGDPFLRETALHAVLSPEVSPEAIRYRQAILKDCLANPQVVKQMYDLSVEVFQKEKKHYFGIFTRYPSAILGSAVDVMTMLVEMLARLRGFADRHAEKFTSEGFSSLFSMLRNELADDYLDSIREHLRTLKFRTGVLVSAALGEGDKGAGYTLRKPKRRENIFTWLYTWLFSKRSQAFSFYIAERDESGAKAVAELRDRGISLAANALAQSAQHVIGFFRTLRLELSFYIGCMNLYDRLVRKGEPVCFPEPLPFGAPRLLFKGLVDASLSLRMYERAVGNDVDADGKRLVVITGANQGGKTTFLRSVGAAQLMMQCGMFVPARSFRASVCKTLFTHWRREEDSTMKSGKFDEEMSRMSRIADSLSSRSLMLFNESFAATNEREGSEIARQIVTALMAKGVRSLFVTHMYDFAGGMFERRLECALFLRAERREDGKRTYRLAEGEPLKTSFGEDLYRQIFETAERRSKKAREANAEGA